MAVIYGTTGPDIKNGTSGNDTIYGWAKGGNLNSPSGNDTLNGNAGNDQLEGGTGFDNLSGNAGDDTLYGHSGNDSTRGGGGNDKLYGGKGNDSLYGSFGYDSLSGGNGNDILNGGLNVDDVDTLTGGAGRDNFVLTENISYSGFEFEDGVTEDSLNDYTLITDFNTSQDVIMLNSSESYVLLDAPFNVGSAALDTAIYLSGFSGLADELIAVIQDVSDLDLYGSSYFM